MLARHENKILRWHERPADFAFKQNIGYIPNMTSNTAPSPFVAGGGNATIVTPYLGYDGNDTTYAYFSGNTGSPYFQITLDRPVSIWKIFVRKRWVTSSPTSIYVSDDADNVLCTLILGSSSQDISETITLGTPSKRSAYFRVNYNTPSTSTGARLYTFQIYAFE